MTPTAADLRALQVLADAGSIGGAQLGERLWGHSRRNPNEAGALTASAGRVLGRLVDAGLAGLVWRNRVAYTITAKGRTVLRDSNQEK